MSSVTTRTLVGSVIGTGAELEVKPSGGGGTPIMVELFNSDGLTSGLWTESMGTTGVMKVVVTDGTQSLSAADEGVKPVFGGFTLGVDANLNAVGEKIHWVLTF